LLVLAVGLTLIAAAGWFVAKKIRNAFLWSCGKQKPRVDVCATPVSLNGVAQADVATDNSHGRPIIKMADLVVLLEALANGVDPLTGEVLLQRSPYIEPRVIGALFAAAKALRRLQRQPTRPGIRPGKAGLAWTPAEDQLLRDVWLAHVPLAEIARRHQRTRIAIMTRLVRVGLLRRHDPGRFVAASDQGSSSLRETVKWRKRAGRVWTTEEDVALQRGFDAGLTVEQLAQSLQRGMHAVEVRLFKLRQ